MLAVADFIDRHWKPLTFIGIAILLFGAGVLLFNHLTAGSFMPRDFELTGGKRIEMILESAPDILAMRDALPDATVSLIGGLRPTLVIEAPVTANETDMLARLQALGVSGESSVRTIGPVLGELFWKQTQLAIAVAFIVMSIIIFILFRTFAPSSAVVLAALTDASFVLGVLSLMGVRLSLPVLAGVLMLIGYSVDTDIVLTTELLRSSGKEVPQRFRAAAKTGLTLTATSIAALATMCLVSGSIVIQQIATVLIIGLLADIPSTWLTNAGILRWHLERKEKKRGLQ
jgi:preprotein translocase subunit SecF